jgi:nucleoside-diphosphate-sugar epimerase
VLTDICCVVCVARLGIAKAIAKALGKEAKIVLYSPEALGLGKSGKAEGFPFRSTASFRSLILGSIGQPSFPVVYHKRPNKMSFCFIRNLVHLRSFSYEMQMLQCRTVHFFASSEKAKRELGWAPRHNFLDDVSTLVADYLLLGRLVSLSTSSFL